MTETPDPPKLEELLCYSVYALQLAFGRYYQTAFGETGFTYPKFIALLALHEGGSMSLGELSSRIGVEANSLSPMLKKMHAFGLIDRVRDPEDERRVLLTMKPYGRAVLQEASAVVKAGWDGLGLKEGDVTAANRLLNEARKRLESATPPLMMVVPEPPEG